MSIDLWWLADATETTAKIGLRTTTNGTPVVSCNGNTFTGSSIVAATNDGVGFVTVTGLSSNSSYPFTLTIDSNSVSDTLKTMPASGDNYTFMWGSCTEHGTYYSMPGLKRLVEEYQPAFFLHQGDLYYGDRSVDYSDHPGWGGNEPSEITSGNRADQDNAFEWIRLSFHHPHLKELMHSCPFYWMWDDHEMYNDFSLYNTIGGWPTTPDGTYPQYAASMVELYQTYNGACRIYNAGNPANSDAGIDADPLYPAAYWRKTVGDIEFFQCDPISYRSDPSDADSASKRMLGETQEDWLLAAVAASSAPIKVVSLDKTFFEPQGTGNADTYSDYPTERDRLINALSAITTTCVISGDKHAPQVCYASPDVGTYGYSGYLLDVMASPLASTPFHSGFNGDPDEAYIRWISPSEVNNFFDRYCCVGIGKIEDGVLTLSIVGMDGTPLAVYTLEQGSNEIVI